jgi:putative FmdB family regulatory protein
LVPTYQYACKQCDHQFEAVQSFTDASLTDCPECYGPLRKLFGSVGVIFKGSGFYRTDARSGNGSAKKAESTTSDSSSSSGSNSSSDKSSTSTKSSDSKSTSTPAAKAS